MTTSLKEIQDELGKLKLDNTLLFFNHVLSVSRGLSSDPALEPHISSLGYPLPPHIVHFLAKQLLLHGSNLGIHHLTWDGFRQLVSQCISLDDPIQHDPDWKHADPGGFFERLTAQQISPQRRNLIQKYGLAKGLFRDTEAVEWPQRYSLRDEIEQELGIAVEQFMAMGHVFYALRQGLCNGQKCLGTFTPPLLAEAFDQGLDICVPEVWGPFLRRVACDRDTFREVCNRDVYKSTSPLFTQFEFNPLVRFPLIEVTSGHFVAVDPDLIVERVTFGMFYDLFEKHGLSFTEKFGHVFERFVGEMLAPVSAPGSLWSAAKWEQEKGQGRNHGKIGDWALVGRSQTVLFDCKSQRPSLKLTTYGSDDSIQDVAERIGSALEQLLGHSDSIQTGAWADTGIPPSPTVCAIITYGRINTVNGPFLRKRVLAQLSEKGLDPPRYVILSLEELDSVIRLVELGHELDEIIYALAVEKESFDVLRRFHEELRDCCVSSLTLKRGRDFMNSILPNTIAE